LARLADRIFTSFDRTEGGFDPAKIWWTGNPLRQQMVQSAAAESPAAGAPPKPFTVLVIGGSQGAHRVNTAVVEALRLLGGAADFFFIHQTGSADEAMVAAAYRQSGLAARVQPFYNDMAAQYAQADLVICRAGATTMAEITALGKTAVLIPYPHASDDHQQRNARRLVDAGAAEMIDEQSLDGERLAARIGFYASHPEISAEVAQRAARLGKPDAARRIVDECYRLVAARTPGRRTNGQTG
jgi:UDP-N-acetylglucosamine--N-acetylmuramyl-(pentapeptide) pyrophosphoryl-undecaprenol N-acetylglucosamine transferase